MTDEGDGGARELAYYKRQLDQVAGENVALDSALAGARHALQKSRRAFALLAQLQQAIADLPELGDVLRRVVDALNTALGMDRTIVFVPGAAGVFRADHASGADASSVGELLEPPSELAAGGAVRVTRATAETPVSERLRRLFGMPYFICLPVLVDAVPIALLVTGRLREARPFYPPLDDEDVDTLRAIAGLVGSWARSVRLAQARAANEQLARLSEAKPEKLEDVSSWGATMADEVCRAIGARQIDTYRTDGSGLSALSSTGEETLAFVGPGDPTWEALESARAGEDLATEKERNVVAVLGMTGELRGALVIEGSVVWGEVERRLVGSLAHHLGSALDLAHLRQQLTVTEARQAAARDRMREQGVPAAKVCPKCGRCYEEAAVICASEGSPLDGSRLLPFLMNGRYRMERLLGEGGMGSVFAAHDERLKRSVALKVIRAELLNDPQVRFRLEREARTLAQIQHPSVIALFDSGELEDGSAFLVMELLSGRDLKEVLQASGPGTPAQVAELLAQTSSALATAHRAGVVHRDIKPANVFMVPAMRGFQTKLLDFGLAKSTGGEAHLTRTGMVMGTPAYMSPEQVQGQEVDARSDLYSLAALVYEALTGRRTVVAYEMTQILVDVLYTEPPKVSSLVTGLPDGIDEAFASALAKKPSDRPPDVATWAAGLVPLLASAGGRARGWPDFGGQG